MLLAQVCEHGRQFCGVFVGNGFDDAGNRLDERQKDGVAVAVQDGVADDAAHLRRPFFGRDAVVEGNARQEGLDGEAEEGKRVVAEGFAQKF